MWWCTPFILAWEDRGKWEFEANQKYIVRATQRVHPRKREEEMDRQTDRERLSHINITG